MFGNCTYSVDYNSNTELMEDIHMQNLASFIEYENGKKQNTHVFMRMQMDNGKIEEIDLFANDKVRKYKTRLDDSIREGGKGSVAKKKMRIELINAFEALLKVSGLHIA